MGGVSPGKGGKMHLELPVFDTVKEVYSTVDDEQCISAWYSMMLGYCITAETICFVCEYVLYCFRQRMPQVLRQR